ncbi:hypothetical protein [Bombilactobacillus thymidiniphilus]|uniref:Uncharacterized protein n=1 Tax=Bombilactobacillus thymidiniphilus TaxID=2923363 RepID=A0ABY4PES3_9LACO|nr:hypothetical protein [Bombilactobacillus thymidiniphilus]UQS84303.1 hypothetical protein MOO47_03905 [Bombilactobacillus thymidiniphilus]
MFNLTFEQSEKVTDYVVKSLIQSLNGQKKFTTWHILRKFFASLFFVVGAIVMAAPILMDPKTFNIFTIFSYVYLFLILFAVVLSFIVYIVLSFTKNIAFDYIFSLGLLCFYVYIIFFIAAAYIVFYLFFIGKINWLLVTFYGFVFILAIIQTAISYLSFRETFGICTNKFDVKLKKFDKFIAKYGSIIVSLIFIFKGIKCVFFNHNMLSRSFKLLIAMIVFVPIMIFAIVYLCGFYMPFKVFIVHYYLLKYKKEYQKKILDEYQVDFFNLEKHNKKYN